MRDKGPCFTPTLPWLHAGRVLPQQTAHGSVLLAALPDLSWPA